MLPYSDFEAQHLTLVPSTDTLVTPSRKAYAFRVVNWSTTGRVLVKATTITSDVDAAAARVGAASAANFPQVRVFPVQVHDAGIHIRAAFAAEVTVEFFI